MMKGMIRSPSDRMLHPVSLMLVLVGCIVVTSAGEMDPPLPTGSVATIRVPTMLLGLKSGQEVMVDERSVKVDGLGLELPLGVPVALAWNRLEGVEERLTVVNTNANTGSMMPAWASDAVQVTENGVVCAVGWASSMTANLAVAKAVAAARMAAVRGVRGGGTTETRTRGTPRSGSVGTMAHALEGLDTVVIEGDGTEGSPAVRVTSRVRDAVVALCADERSIPPLPAGETLSVRERSASRQVRCWVRILAHVKPLPAADSQAPDPQAQAEAERHFAELDRMIGRQLPATAP